MPKDRSEARRRLRMSAEKFQLHLSKYIKAKGNTGLGMKGRERLIALTGRMIMSLSKAEHV